MPSLQWYARRLRAMSLTELVTMRAYRAVRDRVLPTPTRLPGGLTLDLNARQIVNVLAQNRKGTCSAGDEILRGHIHLFGRDYELGQRIAWNRDPESGQDWPMRPAYRLDYRNLKGGDPKYVWELNRHPFMLTLARAYVLSGDERYARGVVSLIQSWIGQCPPGFGINWTSGIELAIRQISWLWTLRLLGKSPTLTAEFRGQVAASMFLQTQQIRRHLSFYSSANNHLIAELAALVVVGRALSQVEWVTLARSHLIEQVTRQFRSDGVGVEQSPAYAEHSLEFYLLAELELRRAKQGLPEAVWERLTMAGYFLRAISDTRGTPANFGDSDSGVILPLSEHYHHSKSLRNLLAHLSGEATLLEPDVREDEKLVWVTGGDQPLAAGKALRPRGFARGGYYILESSGASDRMRVIFDAGPLGMAPMCAHGHADALSFMLWLNDTPVLIDPGTYTYFGPLKWRDYFRSTAAHNTVRVDRLDQCEFGGRFLATRMYEARLGQHGPHDLVAEHDGYRRLAHPVIHRRTLQLTESNLRLCDELQGNATHDIEIMFHFAPNVQVTRVGTSNTFDCEAGASKLTLLLEDRLETTIYHGDETGPWGFCSPVYGVMQPCPTVVGRLRVRLPLVLESHLGLQLA